MTTGVPIYLVSACTTGEEFVAAFRRYADRGSVFVPIADPIPSGRRGRFALTLSTGVVMIEGEGEVISSARTPSALHGRVGMTIRFAELDDDSKTVLIELEKARLVAKPAAPVIATRTAALPSSPRPKPPSPSARVDAATTLAETVAIGDLEQLASTAPAKAGPKFVMPTVLPVGSARPKTPSSPPEIRPKSPSAPPPVGSGRPKAPSVPPPMPSLAPLPESKSGPIAVKATVSTASETQATDRPIGGFSVTMPAVVVADLKPPEAVPLHSALANASAEISAPRTSLMEAPPALPLRAQIMAAVTIHTTPTDMTEVDPPGTTPTQMATVVPMMTPTEMAAVPPPPNVTKPMPAITPSPVRRPTPPPMQALRPQAPVIGDPPPRRILVNSPDLDEPTDLTAVPVPPEESVGRRTVIGVAVAPDGVPVRPAVLPAVTTPDASLDDAELVEVEEELTPFTQEPDVVPRPVAAKPPTIEEATPSGDWTMTPGADGPTIAPRTPESEPQPPPKPAARLTGDWTIQLDSDSPDGWSEPSRPDIPRPQLPVVVKLEKPAKPKAENPPELAAVSRSIIVDSARRELAREREPVSEEPKIQIDPTLMDAPIVTPDPPALAFTEASGAYAAASRIATPIPGTVARPPGLDSMIPTGQMPIVTPIAETPMATPVPGFPPARPTPTPGELAARNTPAPQRGLTDGGVGFFRDSGEIPNLMGTGSYASRASTSRLEARRRRRIIVIGASTGVVLAMGIVLVVALAGGKKTEESVANATTVDASVGSNHRVIATPADANVEAPPPVADAAVAPAKQCFADIASVPAGAEVLLGKEVIGTTPAKLPLPCGEEAKLLIRKLKFANQLRPVMPTEDGAKVQVTLQKLVFSIKLSSQPAGASISINGQVIAMTPTTMKVPAFELSTITFSKDGFASETFKVIPKQNNQTVHAKLTRKR